MRNAGRSEHTLGSARHAKALIDLTGERQTMEERQPRRADALNRSPDDAWTSRPEQRYLSSMPDEAPKWPGHDYLESRPRLCRIAHAAVPTAPEAETVAKPP
jgi:hypothetical protein